jgi:hypothetical protein
MWTIEDNGKDITWPDAEQYCKNHTLGGLSGWELPTIDELEKLYDPQNSSIYKIRKPFLLTDDWVWSSTKEGSGSAWLFVFGTHSTGTGRAHASPVYLSRVPRALCVRRSGK